MGIDEEKREIKNWQEMKSMDKTKAAQVAYLAASTEVQNLCEYLFNQGVQNGLDHSAPSKKTMEELTIIKVSQARHEEKLDSIKDTLVGHISKEDETFQRLEKVVADFMTKADDKYSPISAWKVIVWSGRIVGASLLLSLLGLLARAFIHLN